MTRVVVDTSVLTAIAFAEPEAESFSAALLASDECYIAEPTWLETRIVVAARKGEVALEPLEELRAMAGIVRVPFEEAIAAHALHGWMQYGKGRHAAGLNFGDCFAYGLARFLDAPLLYKGDDFARTDVRTTF